MGFMPVPVVSGTPKVGDQEKRLTKVYVVFHSVNHGKGRTGCRTPVIAVTIPFNSGVKQQ